VHLLSSPLHQFVEVSISPALPSPEDADFSVLVQFSPAPLNLGVPLIMTHADSPPLKPADAQLERGEGTGDTQAACASSLLSDGSPSNASWRLTSTGASSSDTSPVRPMLRSPLLATTFASAASAPAQLGWSPVSADLAVQQKPKTLHPSPRSLFSPSGGVEQSSRSSAFSVSGSAATAAAGAGAAAAAASVASSAQPAWQTPIDLTRHLSTLLAPVRNLFSSFPAAFAPSAASADMSQWVAMQRVLLVHSDLQESRLRELHQRSSDTSALQRPPYTPIPAMLFGGTLSANSSCVALLLSDVATHRPVTSGSEARLHALADLRRRLLQLERQPLCGAVKPHMLEQQDAIAQDYRTLSA